MKNLLPICNKREKHAWKGKGHSRELINNVAHLCRVAFQKVSSRRNIEEQVLHGNTSSICYGNRFLCLDHAVFDFKICPCLILRSLRFYLHLRNRSNRRQRLTTKSHGTYVKKIFYCLNL